MQDSDKQEMLDLLSWIEKRIQYYADPSSYDTLSSEGAGFALWDRGETARSVIAMISRHKDRLREIIAASRSACANDPAGLVLAMRPHLCARLRDVQLIEGSGALVKELSSILAAADAFAKAHRASKNADH